MPLDKAPVENADLFPESLSLSAERHKAGAHESWNALTFDILWSDRSSVEKPVLATVRDDATQASFVIERVLANREAGVPLKEQAVLFRTSHHSAVLEIELSRRNIPFVKFGGLKFLEAVHIKDLLAVLRWAENSLDRMTGFRVLQLLPGIGPGSAGKLLDRMAGHSLVQSLAMYRPPARAADDWPRAQPAHAATLDENGEMAC
jgi:DNA helicase II / ATP-dependent DNA helicase PcrA